MATTPLFTKTFDFVSWLLAVTNHFPRSQRFFVTKRLLDAALEGDPRTSRGLFEDHGQRLAGERPRPGGSRAVALAGEPLVQDAAQRGGVQPIEIEEVPGAAHVRPPRPSLRRPVQVWPRPLRHGSRLWSGSCRR